MTDHAANLKTEIAKLADVEEDFPGQNDEHRRQLIVEATYMAAVEMILANSTDGREESDYLISAVARKLQGAIHANLVWALRLIALDRRRESQHGSYTNDDGKPLGTED